jgi:hypothetical protein
MVESHRRRFITVLCLVKYVTTTLRFRASPHPRGCRTYVFHDALAMAAYLRTTVRTTKLPTGGW